MDFKDYKLYLDIDRVLANWDQHFIDTFGYDPNYCKRSDFPWSSLDYRYWSTIPLYDGALAFYRTLRKESGWPKLLTGSIRTEGCYSGKAHWVTHALGGGDNKELERLILCLSRDKQLLARPKSILVDDKRENIEAWVNEGGIGIEVKSASRAPEYQRILHILNAGFESKFYSNYYVV